MKIKSNKVALKGGRVTHYMSADTKQLLNKLVKKTKWSKSKLISEALKDFEWTRNYI